AGVVFIVDAVPVAIARLRNGLLGFVDRLDPIERKQTAPLGSTQTAGKSRAESRANLELFEERVVSAEDQLEGSRRASEETVGGSDARRHVELGAQEELVIDQADACAGSETQIAPYFGITESLLLSAVIDGHARGVRKHVDVAGDE